MTEQSQPLISIADAVDLLPCKVSRQTIVRWIQLGVCGHKLPATRIGYHYKVDPDDLAKFIADLQVEEATA